ncbi:hypothetical protein FKW77_009599 [Venturia effusa]|uniref:Uncharacterized protein n=1 Tax=Venturia effusa TaxID=50376 RepID=A0A517L214_9PEZI|nr:hypothetical protein FKW77_009599 [Venturia effusa]
MSAPRNTALRAIARPAWGSGTRVCQQTPFRYQYSTAKDAVKSSSSVPWALSAIALTGGGTYLALQPRVPVHHDDHSSSHLEPNDHSSIVEKASDLKESAYSKTEDINQQSDDEKDQHKEKAAASSKSLIKGERSGDSVKNHGIASEKNEHKVREGKFSDDEFDNHITKHSNDPGRDFEKIRKDKETVKAKGE